MSLELVHRARKATQHHVERLFGIQIARSRLLRADPLADLATFGIPGRQHVVVFDVGANVGNTVAQFLTRFADVEVHAFEPAPDTFRTLSQRIHDPRVRLVNAALSLTAGESRMDSSLNHDLRRLGEGDQTVRVTTLAEYVQENTVERIDYLKIDTEGHDLDVLRGGLEVLPRVGAIEVEVSMNKGNTAHVPLAEVLAELERWGFRLFGVYEQRPEPGRAYLRRANCVFVPAL
jgi:FkbM family methyltransferase